MASNIEAIAEAFSRHRFAETYRHLAVDVRWELIGGSTLTGRDAVIEASEESNRHLAHTTTEFGKFKTVVGSDSVAVDSLAEYVDPDGDRSVVASCDLYDFVDGAVTAITSYTVEVRSE